MDFLRKIHRKPLETAQTVVKSGTAYFLPRDIIFLRLCRNDCNLINGVYSCENLWLLTDVLRKEWGFDGFVVTDWDAMNERVAALKAGLELEVPSSRGTNDRKLVQAVRDGTLDEAVLDNAVAPAISATTGLIPLWRRQRP